MKKLLYSILVVALLANAFFGFRVYSLEIPNDTKEILEKMELFVDVLQQVRANYVDEDEVDIDSLFNSAIKGMVYSLDPFSQFMTPDEFNEFLKQEDDSFGGIGVQVHMQDGLLTVSSVLRGTPAAEAGVLAGDQITAIDGVDQKGKALDEIVGKLRGAPGSKVTVTIKRPDEAEPIEVPLARAIIENESVSDVHVIEGTRTGFLRIDWFMEPTAKQFEKALKELEVKGIDSLIIDVRNNPGGRVDTCVEILSYFLKPNDLIATLEGRNSNVSSVYKAAPTEYHFPDDLPIAILGDRGSASAAEIMISTLRDYHRAVFIGERTFGKALVQDVRDLGGGNALKFTIAKYYTKEHTPIQGIGIKPDIESKLVRKDYIAIMKAKSKAEADTLDPNVQAALEFFRNGAQWDVYKGNPAGDYPDLLPQWQKDETKHYKLYDYDIYQDLAEGEKEGDSTEKPEGAESKQEEE